MRSRHSPASLQDGTHLLNLMAQKHVTEEGFGDLIQTGLLADLFAATAYGRLRGVNREKFRELIGLGRDAFDLSITRGYPLEELIAMGKYDYVDPLITSENFPLPAPGQPDFDQHKYHCELLGYDRICPQEASKVIRQQGWFPGKLEHLLAFGYIFPGIQRKFPIVASGTYVLLVGREFVPVIDTVEKKRALRLVDPRKLVPKARFIRCKPQL